MNIDITQLEDGSVISFTPCETGLSATRLAEDCVTPIGEPVPVMGWGVVVRHCQDRVSTEVQPLILADAMLLAPVPSIYGPRYDVAPGG